MAFYDKFPYTNFQELNLDKIIQKIGDIDRAEEATAESAEAAATSAAAAADSAAATAASANRSAASAAKAEASAVRVENLQGGINNLQTQIDIERARIDQFTNLPEGSTTGDAELADGRVGYDGITYANIGSAIRSQIGNIYRMTDTVKEFTEIFPHFNTGFINPSTLLIVESGTAHEYSDPVYVPAGKVLWVPKTNKSLSVSLLVECSDTGAILKLILRGVHSSHSDGSYIGYPFVTGTWVRIGFNNTMNDYRHFYLSKLEDYVITADNHTFISPISVSYSAGPIIDSGAASGTAYLHSSFINVPKGFTIEYWSCGSSTNHAITAYDAMENVTDTVYGSRGQIMHNEYTMQDYGCIRLSARVYAPADVNSAVLPPEKLYGWKIFYKPNHNQERKDTYLFGKKICAIGDSLIYGNQIGPGATWLTTLAYKYNGTPVNLGANGGTIANSPNEEVQSVYERLNTIPDDADYIVVLGGANDKRLNIPLGSETDSSPATFNGALNLIAESLRTDHPKAKIIFMSTYNRYTSVNSLGLHEIDYADAMINAAKRNSIPSFNNFTESGVNMTNEAMRNWMDESRNRQLNVNGTITYVADTHHFSVEGYDWLLPIYEERLKEL